MLARTVNAGTPEAYMETHAMIWSTEFGVIDLNYYLQGTRNQRWFFDYSANEWFTTP